MPQNTNHAAPADSLAGAIGNTPLIRLAHASALTGCTIYGKAEFMNPGGSVKDRAALSIILAAERAGTLQPGGTIVEGSAGNTGIAPTLGANARGYRSIIVMPETQSREKIDTLRMIGADLRLVPAKPFRDPGNYVHAARRLAEEMGAFYANQFDNLANRAGHHRTGEEYGRRREAGSMPSPALAERAARSPACLTRSKPMTHGFAWSWPTRKAVLSMAGSRRETSRSPAAR